MDRIDIERALQKKYPEWIDLVVSRASDGPINAMPVGWSMIASGTPRLYAVAINRGHHTTRLIAASKEFVVAVPSAGMGDAVLYCGTHSGRDGDKIGPAGLRLAPAAEIATPLIEGAVYNLECTLHNQVVAGDHILFIGEIVAAHHDPDAGGRLLNFGDGMWACGRPAAETRFTL
jgi:flavin reductase (DIM6/NTAB) family NADH-FMN oxidoreductase RutF